MSQDPDSLTLSSRQFYERSKAKLVVSVIVAAASMMLLGFCASAGGQAASANEVAGEQTVNAYKLAYKALVSGYGFAAFCYILSCILLILAAVYISPLFCGTAKEKNMIKTPSENFAYASYDDSGKQI